MYCCGRWICFENGERSELSVLPNGDPYFLFFRRKKVNDVNKLIEKDVHDDEVREVADKEIKEVADNEDATLDDIFVLRDEPDKKKRKSSSYKVAKQ